MRRHLRSVGGLTMAALLSSGSTYLLFVLFAQAGSREDLGTFVAVNGLVLLVAQLLDGGSGLLMVRDVSQAASPAERAGIIRQTAKRRGVATVASTPAVLAVTAVLFTSDGWRLATTAALLLGMIGYGFTVQVLQAAQKFRHLVALQCCNAALFVVLGAAAWALVERPSATLMLAVPAAAFGALSVAGAPIVWHATRDASPVAQGRAELRAVRLGTWGTAVSGNVDMVLLGSISPATTAVYAGGQRAALGVGAVSAALMSVMLPVVAAGDPQSHETVLRRSTRLALPVAAAGALLGLGLAPVLGWLYGDPSLAPVAMLMVLLAGFSIGALSNAPVAVLYARKRGADVARLSLAQAVAIVGGCAAGAWLEDPLVVAVGVAAPRLLYLTGALAMARKASH